MLSNKIRTKLESIRDLPTIPIIISEVLSVIDNPDSNAVQLASLIEKDQALTARVLRIANSPFYGFSRAISTIDLAIVIMGMNTLKEIVLSLIIKRFFSKISTNLFDTKAFWNYSVYCGASARLLSRKLGFKVTGEAFVGGLIHDIGYLVLVEYFKSDFTKIVNLLKSRDISPVEAERLVIDTDHCEIGAWIAEKWNFPEKIVDGIRNHHTHFTEQCNTSDIDETENIDEIEQPLTAIVSLSEWFAESNGFKGWLPKHKIGKYYFSHELFDDIEEDDFTENLEFIILNQEILDEYEKASIFAEV